MYVFVIYRKDGSNNQPINQKEKRVYMCMCARCMWLSVCCSLVFSFFLFQYMIF